MIKKEFLRRLIRLDHEISVAITRNSVEYGLMPALFSVFSYLWTGKNAIKKKR